MSTVARLQRMHHGSHFRAFTLRGGQSDQSIDPFLAVDHAWIGGPTFPPHPHAGFSAVSYLFLDSETGIDNRDALGNRNLIQPGGLHWTVAGSGVVHEEVPAEPGKTVHMLQVFINLPLDRQTQAPFAFSWKHRTSRWCSYLGRKSECRSVASPGSLPLCRHPPR